MGRMGFCMVVCCVLTGLAAACTSSKKATTTETQGQMASLYNPSKLSLHPDFSIYHQNTNYSLLYIRAYPSELRFNETNTDAEYRALLQVKYELIGLDETEGKEGAVIDSASVVYKLQERDERSPAFFASLSIPVRQGKRYLLKLETRYLKMGSMGL